MLLNAINKYILNNIRGLCVLFMITVCSCEHIVHVELADSEPLIVIEGNFTNEMGYHIVKISKSMSFHNSSEFPLVSGADVVIKGSDGFVEKLTEVSPGKYTTSFVKGTPKVTYTLTVKVEGETYISQSYMPPPINMDTVFINKENFEWWERKPKGYRLYCQFFDGQENGDYILFRTNIDGKLQEKIFVFSDEYVNARLVQYRFYDIDIYKGSRVFVEVCSIDEKAYKYFKSLRNVIVDNEGGGRSGPVGAIPSNPECNFTNGALGCFVAFSICKSNSVTAQ